jgi:protein tyrosine phosphatase (PTP) superfamily phosphohydrolase (DUF442 family)
MASVVDIRGFLRLDDRIATSGMPLPEHFAAMRGAGFEVVINLAVPTSDNAIANEGELVAQQGMTYVHIPVNFERPTTANFDTFSRVMDIFADRKVFVHCAANMRVSAFMYLYRVRKDPGCEAQAIADMHKIWRPDGVWKDFIEAQVRLSL